MIERRSSGGVEPSQLAAWERRAFSVLRRQAELVTVVDDELPDDPLADLGAMRATLRRLGYQS